MTTAAPSPLPRWRRALSIRTLFLLLVSMVGFYVLGLSIFLAIRMHPGAVLLRQDTEPVVELFGVLNGRSQRLEAQVRDLQGLVSLGPPGYPAALTRLRQQLTEAPDERSTRAFTAVPEAMRTAMATADEAIARVETAALEVVSLLELDRYDAAQARMMSVNSLVGEMNSHLAEAERRGLSDLVRREDELSRATSQALRAVVIWLAIGLFFLPTVLFLAFRRLGRPLRDLEEGLGQVADGDLHAQLPVQYADEIGRLAEHFNHMTSVLRERAEEQGRFAAAGELIAGVAHEVNNPLMAISAIAQQRLEDNDLRGDDRQDLTQILRQSRRAGKLLSGLLRFARSGSEPRAETANVGRVLREAIDLVSYQFGVAEITLDAAIDSDLPRVHGDPARLEQVFVNLLSNAIHAVRQVPPPRRIAIETRHEADAVWLTLSDNGPGIPTGVLRRLFRPFVTTKGRQGTGLGLYISRQIVRDAGGDIDADISPEGGARFRIRLRAAGEGDWLTTPRDQARSSSPATLEGVRILLVDDEAALRRPIARFLSRRGAAVGEAADGLEAMERIEALDGRLDVLLVDLRMPRMDGVALHAELRKRYPALADRVVFLSGDLSHLTSGSQPLEVGDQAIPADRILLKPVALEEVETRLLQVAQQAPPAA
jgi:C4-dicarboxylate-specific signal transduction histidine kinase/ActR/RegA family two-component response regulator